MFDCSLEYKIKTVFLKMFLKKLILKKVSRQQQKHEKLLRMQRVKQLYKTGSKQNTYLYWWGERWIYEHDLGYICTGGYVATGIYWEHNGLEDLKYSRKLDKQASYM